VVNEF